MTYSSITPAYLRRISTEEYKKLYGEPLPQLRFRILGNPNNITLKLCINHYDELSIQASAYQLNLLSLQEIREQLRHILVHVNLFRKGLPFTDSTPTFKWECKRLKVKTNFN